MNEIMPFLPMAALLLVTGALAGLIAGLLGVGGGIVLVPGFFYAFTELGYAGPNLMQICLATSLATVVVTSLRSVAGHSRRGAVDWNVLRRWGPGIVMGALLGMLAASSLRSVVLQGIFGGLGILIGIYLGFVKVTWRLGSELPGGAKRLSIAGMIGFLSVLMGIGGGSFGVPLMTMYGRTIHNAVATASGFGVIIAVPAVLGFLLSAPEGAPPWTIGAVNIPAFLVVISMTLLTAPVGVRLAHAMDPKPLRMIFAVFLIVIALNMLRKALGF